MKAILLVLVVVWCCAASLSAFAGQVDVADRFTAASVGAGGTCCVGTPSVVTGFEETSFFWDSGTGSSLNMTSQAWFNPTTSIYTYVYKVSDYSFDPNFSPNMTGLQLFSAWPSSPGLSWGNITGENGNFSVFLNQFFGPCCNTPRLAEFGISGPVNGIRYSGFGLSPKRHLFW